VIGAGFLPGKPCYDHSPADKIDQVVRLPGRPVRRAHIECGYRGHGLKRQDLEVVVSHSRSDNSPAMRRKMRRRNSCRTDIRLMKADGLRERNRAVSVSEGMPTSWIVDGASGT
jgi:transposase, IS5 family